MYKLTKPLFDGAVVNTVQRLSDGACIPFDPANTDFLEYQKWLSLGNQPFPPDEPTLPETV